MTHKSTLELIGYEQSASKLKGNRLIYSLHLQPLLVAVTMHLYLRNWHHWQDMTRTALLDLFRLHAKCTYYSVYFPVASKAVFGVRFDFNVSWIDFVSIYFVARVISDRNRNICLRISTKRTIGWLIDLSIGTWCIIVKFPGRANNMFRIFRT